MFYAPGAIRTRGTEIRNLVLYPPELRGREHTHVHMPLAAFCQVACVSTPLHCDPLSGSP